MDREMLLDHLAQGERHVAEGERLLDHQRALIVELSRDGHDTSQAEDLLRTFEDTQAIHLADLDRIRTEFAEAQ